LFIAAVQHKNTQQQQKFLSETTVNPQSPSVISTYTEKGKARYLESKLHARKATTKELKMLNF